MLLLATATAVAASLAGSVSRPAGATPPTLSVTLTTADGTSALSAQSGITLGPVTRGTLNVNVDDSHSYQTINGFGAAFTDSSTLLMNQLKQYSSSTYNTMMNELFSSSSGIDLNFWRLPMTSSDFNSTSSPWTDDDTQGPAGNLTQYFGLTAQDTGHIIPTIQDALAINSGLQIVASAWSPPAWMKSNDSMICNTGSGNASLNTTDDQAWADYFVKWIQAYQADGIPIWAVTPQNEPLYCPTNYPGSSWDAPSETSWVHNYLAPDLAANSLSPLILGFDHNWDDLSFPQSLATGSAAGNLGGMAWHCYDNGSDPAMMSAIHNQYGYDEYETECSSDTAPTDIIPYTTAEMALRSVQNWARGAILWNVALNSSDGPHLGGCADCVPIVTINTTVDGSGHVTSASYSLDNNYYQLGQISKFVPPGSTHIGSTLDEHGIVTAAFKRTDGNEVLVATNINSSSSTFEVTWNGQGSFSYTLPSHATVTFVGTVPAAPAAPSTPISGDSYHIVNRLTGKPFGISGGSTSNGAQVIQYKSDGDPDQEWSLVSVGSGEYNIVDDNSGLVLDDTGGSTSNGTVMQQWAASSGDANQEWSFTSVGSGYYTITNLHSGLVLDLTGGSISDSTDIQQWTGYSGDLNQEWALVGAPTVLGAATLTAGQTYRVVSTATGKPIDVNGGSTSDGATIVEEADNDALDQEWTMQSAGSGYYNLINVNSGKALDDTGGSTTNGTQMQQYTISGTGNSNQQWQISSVGGGSYTLTNRTSSKDLDLTGGAQDDGTAIQQWTATGGDVNQEFTLIPIS